MPATPGGAEGALPESVAEAGQRSPPLGPRRFPLGHPAREPHLHRHLSGQRDPEQPGHGLGFEPARTAAPYDDAHVPGHHPHPGRHPARRGHGPQLPRHHHQDEVQLRQHLGHGLVDPPGQVDHHHPAPAARGGQHRTHRGGRHDHPVPAVPAEHPQRMQFGKGLLQGSGTDAAPRTREVGPAQPFGGLAPEQDVHAAAERVPVDEDGPLPRAGGPECEGAGEGGGSGAAAPSDHTDGQGGASGALDHIGDAVDEEVLGVGQPEHLLRADLHGPLPHLGVVEIPADEEHPSRRGAPRTRRAASSPTSTSGADSQL